MRGVKNEERLTSPLFPRLHVNDDTEKGGPRAPPRNKMAFCEQLGIPSQRLSSGSASILHLPFGNQSGLVPSMCSSHGCGYERNGLTLFSNLLAPSHLSEKVFPRSSDGKESINATNDHSLRIELPLLTTAKCSSSQSQEFSNFNHLLPEKPEDENDFRIPSSAHSGASAIHDSSRQFKDPEDQPQLNLSCSMLIENFPEKHKEGSDTIIPEEKTRWRNQKQENSKGSHTCHDYTKRSTSVSSTKGITSVDASSSPAGRVKTADLLKRARPSSDQDHPNMSINVLKCSLGTNACLNQEWIKTKDQILPRGKENALKLRSKSYMMPSLEDDKGNSSGQEDGNKHYEDKKSIQFQMEHVDRLDDIKTSMVDSITDLNISPNDVVGVIGEKQFWKARRAIVSQQRVFAIQVFELHRLVKVQKSIAGSPHLLLQDDIYVGQASLKVSPVRKQPFEYAIEQPCLIPKQKIQSQKPHPSTKHADENAVPHADVINEASNGLPTPQSDHMSHSGSAPPVAMLTNTKLTPWCFPLSGNQWIVPVMSPSEGLIYKPYPGPCLPPADFMAPFYGGCAPMSNPAGGDFLNAAYSVPASRQDGIGIVSSTPSLGKTYFSTYGLPFMKAKISGSPVEQISPSSRADSKDNQLSVGNINLVLPHRSLCNTTSQVSRVICVGKYQASKESDKQGSTASSPSEKAKGNELPLFPTEPTVPMSDQNAKTNKAHVIKVVPHNPRSATESAARIFQFIQEERNRMLICENVSSEKY